MESEKFSSSGLYWLCKEAENRSTAADSPSAVAPEIAPPQTDAKVPDLQVDRVAMVAEAPVPAGGEKRRRGRPAKGEGKAGAAVTVKVKKKKKEDEDVCFICFDGGNLVLCDRGDCPKAYHPACIKRDEAFFRSNARWTCGWHICSKCQKSAARYMCYTCTYSLCKVCTKDADYLCVRENKGFCPTCFRVVAMIENIDQGNNETVQVDFDDKLTWEYLFKVYWICLKEDLSLTVDEITRAQKPWTASNKVGRRDNSSAVYYLGNNGTMTRENPSILNKAVSSTLVKSVRDNNNTSVLSMSWASKELLNFVGYMRNGDTSVLSQKEVQALLFDYIKRNNLRDPHQRSEIVCDSKLEVLFGKPRVRHFEMLSLLEFHFLTKDESQKDEMQGAIIDPVVKQVAGESNSDNLPMISENYRHKVDKKHEERVDLNKSNEVKDACEILENHVDSSGSTNNGPNNQTCLKSQSVSGVKSETSVASLSTGSTPSANDREAENSWHYRDPKGKVQGPFAIEQLHKWSSTEIFPPNMRIWRLNTEEHDSVLLMDVIKGQVPLQNNHSLSPQEVKGASDCTSHPFGGPKSGSANSAGTDIDGHSNGRLDIVNGNGPVQHYSNGATPVINKDPQINNDYQIKKSSKCRDSDLPKIINSHSSEPQVHSVEQSSSVKEKLQGNSLHQDRSNAEQTCKPSPNNETRSSHGNMVSQTNSRQCQGNQIKEKRVLGQPSLGEPLPQNSTVNNWNFNESHSRYTSNANLTDSSEQMLSVDLQDFSMPKPKTSNGVLEAQTVKEQERGQPPPVTVQKLGTQSVPSLMLESNTTVLENHTVKEQQRRQPPEVSVGIQNVLNLTPESNTKVLEEHTSKEQQMWLPPQVNVQNLGIQNVPSHTSGSNTGVLEARTIKEQQWCQPPQDAIQNLGIQNVLSLTPESNTTVLETHTIKEQQRWPPPQVSIQNLGIQNVLSLTTESDTDELEAHTIKEQQRWQPPQVSAQSSSIQNVLSLTPKSIDHDERDFFGCQKMTSLTDRSEKVPATENQHSLSSNYPAQDCGPSWNSVSSLVLGGGTHLPKKAAKSFMEEWDSGFLSVCSLRSHDVTTSSSKHDELPPPSPPNPVPNASSWLAMMTEPIEFNTLAEESVSDLLAEVDAMESNSDLESPNMLMDYADDLFHDSKTDCFTSLRGLSSPVNRVKNDAFTSSGDMMLPPQASTRDEQNREPKGDVLDSLKKSKRHSSTGSMMEVETKQFDNTANHFEYHSNKHNPSPPKKLRDQLDNPATQFEYRSSKHNSSPPKKIRDLADIMNAPAKHGNLNSPGSSRRESGQGTPRVSGGKNRGSSDGILVREGGHQKHGGERLVSPRERNSSSALTSPRDRTAPGGDSGLNKGRQSWNRQSSFGSGGGGSGSHSRSLPRGQRVCKFYESGYCRKGAFCDYLHP